MRRILICVGAGGVGKTTTAAALAVRAALNGNRTLVLTIDPARRLANSLGLAELGHEVEQVPDHLLDEAAALSSCRRQPGGSLSAMMLDQKLAFDEIVERHAENPEAVARILANPVYSQISSTLAGAQEYAAMAKLHEFDASDAYDTIVVDTPPTSHALDFLDAPQKLTMAIDSPAIEWFRKLQSSKGGWSVVGSSGSYVIKKLSSFVGSRFIEDLAVFFTEFNDILGGFRERAEETFETLRRDYVGFIIVASPEPMTVREALFFHERLLGSDMNFDGFLVNRLHQHRPAPNGINEVEEALQKIDCISELGYQPTTLRMAAEAMIQAHADVEILAEADLAAAGELQDRGGPVRTIPFLAEDVHDLDRLTQLGEHLMPSTQDGRPDD